PRLAAIGLQKLRQYRRAADGDGRCLGRCDCDHTVAQSRLVSPRSGQVTNRQLPLSSCNPRPQLQEWLLDEIEGSRGAGERAGESRGDRICVECKQLLSPPESEQLLPQVE